MPAYLIVNYKVENPDLYGQYAAAAGPALSIGDKCKLLVLDPASESLEGSPAPQTVVLEYPTKEEAKAAYESKAYQDVVGMRHDATTEHFAVLVNGMG
jgi:uncharacterized protein (DUF1330 family)